MTLLRDLRAAEDTFNLPAQYALHLFRQWAPVAPRIPGCDTILRLAYRISFGLTAEQAAAREYVYRWKLYIGAIAGRTGSERRMSRGQLVNTVWQPPHLIGQ